MRVQRAAGQFHQGRQQIGGRYGLGDAASGELPRRTDQQRHTGGHFKPVHFVPEAALAEHVAVVARENDQGVVGQAGVFQGLQQLADVAVDVAAGTEVGVAGVADLIHRQWFVPQVIDLEQPLGMRVEVGLGRRRGQWDLGVGVQVPERLGNGVRVVGMGHRHGQAERLVALFADVIEQVLLGLEHHLFVEIQLVGAHTRAGLQHRGHVVIPGRAYVWLIPVHCPAVVGGVDVAGQAFLIAVQLVGAAEVHLARQRSAVAEATQVVGIGRYIGGEIGSVVVGADLARQLAAHQGEARRCAQRAVAIGGVEHHALCRQAAEVGQLDRGRPVERQHRRGHLIGHDEKNVLALHGFSAFHRRCLCQ